MTSKEIVLSPNQRAAIQRCIPTRERVVLTQTHTESGGTHLYVGVPSQRRGVKWDRYMHIAKNGNTRSLATNPEEYE